MAQPMSTDEFTVTLPSNSNMNAYPNNKPHDYVVKLASPLNFTPTTPNTDGHWEVGMSSMQYTNNCYALNHDAKMWFVIKEENVGKWDTQNESNRIVKELIRPSQIADAFPDPIDAELARRHVVEPESTKPTVAWAFYKWTLRAANYDNAHEIVENIREEFNMAFDYRHHVKLDQSLSNNGYLTWLPNRKMVSIYAYTDSPTLAETLGMEISPVMKLSSRPVVPLGIYKLGLLGTAPIHIVGSRAMYVYTNIVKDQYVGDVMAPLLETLPVEGSPSTRMTYKCNPITFLPVARDYIDNIHIYVADEQGDPLVFHSVGHTVIVRLRFRYVNNTTAVKRI